ncbi:MAG: hypothetical protein ABSF09_13850 [Candidatus Bathyarchaeia archaeon]|jgi:hypothetical protein
MKTEISKLEERVDALEPKPPEMLDLWDFSELGGVCRDFWYLLQWTPAEHEEHDRIEAQRTIMIEKLKKDYVMTEEDYEADKRECKRLNELRFDIQKKRLAANEAMRKQVWPELVSRIQRALELVGKPKQELTPNEENEVDTLEDWFDELHIEILKAETFGNVIDDAIKQDVKEMDGPWLSSRPQDQQAVVRKVLARLKEWNQDDEE